MVCGLRFRACQAAWCADRLGSADRPGDGGPVDPGVGDGRQVQLLRIDHQVGSDRQPVELQREMVRRVVLAERQRGQQVRTVGDELVGDPQPGQLLVHEPAEGVRAGPGDHRGPPAVLGRGDRDIGGAAADGLGERLHILQTDVVLQRVQVDTHPTDRQDIEMLVTSGPFGLRVRGWRVRSR